MQGFGKIDEKINAFRQKYYLNLLVRGLLLSLTIITLYFILAAFLEHAFWLNTYLRLSVLLLFFGLVGYCIWHYLKEPIRYLLTRKGIDDEQSARLIGNSLPSVRDKLINLIQLSGFSSTSGLAVASISQKSNLLEPVEFDRVINLKQNYRYLRLLLIPVAVVLALLIFNKSMLLQSTHRIIHFNKSFTPAAPFQFIVQNQSLTAFRNEDFTVLLTLEGNSIPENVYIISGSQRFKMETVDVGQFQYTFEKVQEPRKILFEAASYKSVPVEILLADRPELIQLTTKLEYPGYLQKKNEVITNAGTLEVPEGTVITWEVQTANTRNAFIRFDEEEKVSAQAVDNQLFTFKKHLLNTTHYELFLENENSPNKDRIAYSVQVINDLHPQIAVNNFSDSIYYQQIVVGGIISDDYGLSELRLHFAITNSRREEIARKSFRIPIFSNQPQQSFFYDWRLDSLKLKPGEQIEYYLQVWDNDGVNGRKATRSAAYTLFIPDKDQLAADISKSQTKTEQELREAADKAGEFRKNLDDATQKLKGKQSLDWQEKKRLDEILEQRKNLDQLIKELSDANKMLEKKKDAFTEQDERIRNKAEQIQKLMNELLDEETKKLIEELQKLLRENADLGDIQKMMDKLNKNSKNLENELERMLALYKQLQLEFKTDQLINDLKENIKNQQELLEETERLEKEQSESGKHGKNPQNDRSQELAKEQQTINEEFKKAEQKLEELNKLADELGDNQELPSEDDANQVDQFQKQSKDNLEKNSPTQSKQQQQKAIQKMREMQQKMEEMQYAMEMEMDMQNIESLRQIIHGLIRLSFDQENLIKQFGELQANDPRFNNLAQKQLKIKDDVKVLADSLLALSKRDEMMGSFVIREVNELNDHLSKAIDANHEKRRQPALTEMQFSMTSLNNLALMLDSHFDMLMQMMANAKPSMKSKQKGKQPSLSQLQQQ
ncbi:MAG: DUF4175 family protein, partial [Cyclobacteriaceae bacterium]